MRVEHGDGRRLVGDNLDVHLVQASFHRLQQALSGQQPPEPATAAVGVDDETELTDMA